MTIPPERATTSLNEFGVTGKADGTSTDGRRADESAKAKAAKAKAAKAAKAKSAPQGRNKAMGSAGKKPVGAQQQQEEKD